MEEWLRRLNRLLTVTNFSVLGGSTITNTGPIRINGELGLSPGSSVTGFPPGVNGAKHIDDAVAIKAKTDLVTTYNDAAGATPFHDMTGVNLGGKTLDPGVYRLSSSAQLTGTLTLDGDGSRNPTFIFQIGSTLTTASGSRVLLRNGASGCAVFWKVTSSATLGTTTSFQGNLIALTSITMKTAATIGVGGGVNGGPALARNGALTLDTNVITPPPTSCRFAPASNGALRGAGGSGSGSGSSGGIPTPDVGLGGSQSQMTIGWVTFIAGTGIVVSIRRRRSSAK